MQFCNATVRAGHRACFTVFRAARIPMALALFCLLSLVMFPAFAWADDAQAQSSESDVLWTPPVSITAEPDPSNPGYVCVRATGTNDSPATVRGADLAFAIPDQLVVVKGEKNVHADSIAAGESITAEIVVASAEHAPSAPYKEPGNSGSSTSGSSYAKTNDDLRNSAIILAVVGIGAAAGIAYALRRRIRAREAASNTLCMVLAGALVVGFTPMLSQVAHADEAHPTVTGHASVEVDVNGTPVQLAASLSISSADDLPESAYPSVAWLSTETYVAQHATKAHVTVVSDETFAPAVDASMFSLSDALADCTVTEATRVSDTQADLVIEGLAASDGADGGIHATGAAFASGVSEGIGVIPVEAPQATLPEPEAGEEFDGWDEASSLFTVPVNIDCAEFSAAADSSCFSVPANSAIVVRDVRCEEGGHDATLILSAPGNSPEEQLEALDAALTEAGVLIDAAATNCGELTAVSYDVSRASEYGYETTALEHADATFFANVRVTDARADAVDGPVTLICEAVVDTVDGGAVDFVNASDLDVYSVSPNGSEQAASRSIVDPGTLEVTGQNSFVFETTLDASEGEGSAGEADAFWALLDDADQCGDPLNHLQETAVRSDWAISSCEVGLGASCASNRWGMPLSYASAPVLTIDEAQSLARDGGYTDAEVASKALTAAQEALNAVGSFAKAAVTKDVTEVFSGIGSVLGFVAALTDVSSPPQYTLTDVMNRLDTIQGSLSTLESGVSHLNMQLESFESRTAYRIAVAQLSRYTGILGEDDGIALMVQNTLSKVDNASTAASFGELSEADQKELRLLAESTRAYSQRHGTETVTLTKGLGDLITGNSAIGATGIGSLYYDYVDTYYNWDSQAFDARKQFLAYVSAAYLNGYTASMCELSVELADAQAAGDESRVQALKGAQKTLAKQAGRVGEILSGEVDATGAQTKRSNLSIRTEPRADGGALNLVNKKVFGTSHGEASGMVVVDSAMEHSGMDYASVLKSRDLGRVNMSKLDTAISEVQFTDMDRRLKARIGQPGYSGPQNLSEEFASVGISCEEGFGWQAHNLGSHRSAWIAESGEQRHQHVVKIDPKKSVSDRFAVYHEIAQTGDIYDTKAGEVKRGVRIYSAWTKYYAGSFHWSLNICFEDYRVWIPYGSEGGNWGDDDDWDDDLPV